MKHWVHLPLIKNLIDDGNNAAVLFRVSYFAPLWAIVNAVANSQEQHYTRNAAHGPDDLSKWLLNNDLFLLFPFLRKKLSVNSEGGKTLNLATKW